MAVELATAYINLVPSAKGLAGNIAKELLPVETAAACTGKRAGSSFKSALVAAGPAVAFAGIGAAAIAAAESVHDAMNTIIRTTGATGKVADSLEASFKRVAARTPASFATVSKTLAEVR